MLFWVFLVLVIRLNSQPSSGSSGRHAAFYRVKFWGFKLTWGNSLCDPQVVVYFVRVFIAFVLCKRMYVRDVLRDSSSCLLKKHKNKPLPAFAA